MLAHNSSHQGSQKCLSLKRDTLTSESFVRSIFLNKFVFFLSKTTSFPDRHRKNLEIFIAAITLYNNYQNTLFKSKFLRIKIDWIVFQVVIFENRRNFCFVFYLANRLYLSQILPTFPNTKVFFVFNCPNYLGIKTVWRILKEN